MDQVDPRVLAAARASTVALDSGAIARPARFRRVPEDRGVEDDAARQQQPEGQGVQAREGHVARADHQRQEVVRQAGHHRHDEQEDHRRPVHREQLVVDFGRHERVVRRPELQADHQRLDAAEAEEHERRDHVHDPDALVIGRRYPARPAARLVLRAVGADLWDRGCVGGHVVRWSPRCPRGSRPLRRRSASSVWPAPSPLRRSLRRSAASGAPATLRTARAGRP